MPKTRGPRDRLAPVPEDYRPEEFLNDAALAEYHQRRLDEAGKDSDEWPKLALAALRAKRTAIIAEAERIAAEATADQGDDE